MKTALLVAAVISVAGFSAWKWHGHHAAPAQTQADSLVSNRIWIDHIPKNQRDVIQAFAMLDEEAFGVFNASSSWRGQFEAFRFEKQGDELRVVYPQTGDKEKITARARKCDVKDFDYCLELDGGKGAKKYYSREGWEIEGVHGDALEQKVESLEHTLAP